MPRHTVELDDSFVQHFEGLEPRVRADITAIWQALGKDAGFLPDAGTHVVEETMRGNQRYVICQHVGGWGGWQMRWLFEYFDFEPNTPENVVILLRYQPLKLMDLQPRKAP